jgi:DNA mismatch endonuclease (patch repair protein)
LVDVVDANTRSRMMAGIKGKNTTPEIRLRKALHRAGFRFRLHDANLPGRPDIILPKYRAAIFVHGCFWHRHEGCKNATSPKTNTTFWEAKFSKNVERDASSIEHLLGSGWRVGIVWECAVRKRGEVIVAAELAAWLERQGGLGNSLAVVSGLPSDVDANVVRERCEFSFE